MPKGIQSEVDSGFAEITFLDSSLRGPALARVITAVGPEFVSVDTSGVRRSYRMPESVARDAGLLDDDPEPAKKAPAKKAPAKKAAPKKEPADVAADPFDTDGA